MPQQIPPNRNVGQSPLQHPWIPAEQPLVRPAEHPPVQNVVVRQQLAQSLRASLKLILTVSIIATLGGSIWSATSFERTPGNIPYVMGLTLLAKIAVLTGCSAIALSWLYDIYAASQGWAAGAIWRWPGWHRTLVFAGAIVTPAVVLAIHYGEPFAKWGGTSYGPPTWFWWAGPLVMLAVHCSSLLYRSVSRAN